MLRRRFLLVTPALAFLPGCSSSEESVAEPPAPEGDHWTYFGTYTRGESPSRGIYVSRLDSATGKLSEPELAAEIDDPSFLTLHPNGRFLYAVTEIEQGTVSAFSVDSATGKLTLINTVPSKGDLPCDLELDRSGRMLAVANYSTGSVAAYKVAEDGSLDGPTDFKQHEGSSVHERQKGPHAHSIDFSADQRYVIVSDLGLDKVLAYEADPAAATLAPANEATVAPGSGPRHFAFHPSGKFAYVVNELASTVTAFSYDPATAAMSEIATVSTLPPDGFAGATTTAEIEAHPSGKFLYASNRGHDSLAVFSIDAESGKPSYVENVSTGGRTPRNFAVDPTGRFVLAANQNSDSVTVFRVDAESGRLTPTGDSISVGKPVCIKYLRSS